MAQSNNSTAVAHESLNGYFPSWYKGIYLEPYSFNYHPTTWRETVKEYLSWKRECESRTCGRIRWRQLKRIHCSKSLIYITDSLSYNCNGTRKTEKFAGRYIYYIMLDTCQPFHGSTQCTSLLIPSKLGKQLKKIELEKASDQVEKCLTSHRFIRWNPPISSRFQLLHLCGQHE